MSNDMSFILHFLTLQVWDGSGYGVAGAGGQAYGRWWEEEKAGKLVLGSEVCDKEANQE